MIDASKFPGPAIFQGIGFILLALWMIYLFVFPECKRMWKERKEDARRRAEQEARDNDIREFLNSLHSGKSSGPGLGTFLSDPSKRSHKFLSKKDL